MEKDLVYQSKKPVFWSTGAQTALAEAEVEYKERTDPSIYVEFPILTGPFAGKASIAIWTTTPWTIPANLAITVHPAYKYLVQEFRHPEHVRTKGPAHGERAGESFRKGNRLEAGRRTSRSFCGR